MTRKPLFSIWVVLLFVSCMALGACGEKPQADGGAGEQEPAPAVKMTLHRNSASGFELLVPQADGATVLVHHFTLQRYSNALNYGDGQQKTLLCGDVWYPDSIHKQGEAECIQGNLNFIFLVNHKRPGFENEESHVGAGHGCEIRNVQKFYADGVEFDPETEFDDFECSELRVVLDANMYAVDITQPGHKSSRALPKLDESGNLILTAVHRYDAVYRPDNTIEWDNSLTIKRDGLQFRQAHGGMLQGKAQFFNMVTIGDAQQSTNKFVYDEAHTLTTTPLVGSLKFDTKPYHTAGWVKLYGKGITVTQTMTQPAPRAADNYLMFIFYSGASTGDSSLDRVKVYMQAVRSTVQFGAEGAEIFQAGDEIKVHLKRLIEL